jgi:penicillin-binding protein 2
MLEGNLNWQYRKLYPSKDSIHKPKLDKTDSLRMKLKSKKEVEKDKKKEIEKKKVTENKK